MRSSILLVKNNNKLCERDSFVFSKQDYPYPPPMASLLSRVYIEDGKLSVLDFGGSLGTTYFHLREYLSVIDKWDWSVVEQKRFVEIGNKEISDDRLRFFFSCEECLDSRKPNVILLSGCLQYLTEPYKWLNKFLSYGIKYIIVDRTSFTSKDDFVTVQKVPPSIYEASYPCWFFSEQKMKGLIENKYNVVCEFCSLDGRGNLPDTYFKGFLFTKKF